MKAGKLSYPASRAAAADRLGEAVAGVPSLDSRPGADGLGKRICNPQRRFVLPGRASGGNLSLAEISI
jgi:hypothetical protein